ncbi:CocE/NonD family hydrolase [Streptomyces sp. R41]|uniref:CocE/NonD family hydrolase n=1 Tax=Streptomyces sp. R41 TaxID=3238632 RepID=A0AB39RR61_9ACTN
MAGTLRWVWCRSRATARTAGARRRGQRQRLHERCAPPPQGQELYYLIEWVVAQPWCDGDVGMVGIPYFGSMQVPDSATLLRRGPDLVVLGCRPSIGAGVGDFGGRGLLLAFGVPAAV